MTELTLHWLQRTHGFLLNRKPAFCIVANGLCLIAGRVDDAVISNAIFKLRCSRKSPANMACRLCCCWCCYC